MEANLGQLAKSSTMNPESSMPLIADFELVHVPAKAGKAAKEVVKKCIKAKRFYNQSKIAKIFANSCHRS